MSTPIVRTIRDNYPDAIIHLYVRPYVADLYRNLPWHDDILSFDRSERSAAINQIRKGRYDLGVLLCNSFRTAWTFWRAGVNRRVGFSRDLRWFLLSDRIRFMTHGFPPKRLRFPTLDCYMALLYYLGLKAPNNRIELRVSEKTEKRANELLQTLDIPEGKPVVGVAPGAAWGKAKCWLPERFAEVSSIMQKDHGFHPLLFCGPGEEKLVESIEKSAGARWSTLRGESLDLELFIALVKRCTILVTNDSGPRHVAAGVSVPAVVIFGPTQQELTYIGRDHELSLQADVECGPCQLPVCPTDHECMRKISSEEVVRALIELNKESQRRSDDA
jgi:heptosyltransferase-2